MAVDETVVLPNGRRVDNWWVTDLADTAERMAVEAGVPVREAWALIAQIAESRGPSGAG